MTLNFFLRSNFSRGLECRQGKPTSKSWLRAAIELSSLKSIRDVAKVRKKVPSGKSMVRFSSVRLSVTSHMSASPMDELPLMVLWNSCGKMPLGASWWKIQRRNCLATPAALPGTIMLGLSRERKETRNLGASSMSSDTYLLIYSHAHLSSYRITHCHLH